MTDGRRELYEVKITLPENEEPTSFFFDTYERADLWLSDFDNGEIGCVTIDENPEINYEEIMRALKEMEGG
ncbi:MAG: hypothetical protein IKS98_00210 [Lachnospiraceae bacterium]|nr:hypothetical protein [Lachnospiraceae bacterium]